jgi:hypothetical protein
MTHQGTSGLDSIVEQLCNVCRLSGIERALKIGKVVVDGCFNGDVNGLREKRKRTISYRKLAQRSDLPLSASALNRAVGVYELVQRLPWLANNEKLSLGHLECVLPVREDGQATLLLDAESRSLSVRVLRDLVREGQEPSTFSRGRPPLHPSRRLLKSLHRTADTCRGMLAVCEQLRIGHPILSRLRATMSELTDLCRTLDVQLGPSPKSSAEAAA